MNPRKQTLFLFATVCVLSGCTNNETYRGSWMITVDKKPLLLTYTHYYRGGKSRSEYDYFRVINPENGNLQGEAEYNVRSNPISSKFMTSSSLFIEIDKEWECRNLRNMKLRWDNDGFIGRIHKEKKNIEKIHEVNYYNDVFTVTSTVGEIFTFSRQELEGTNDSSSVLPLEGTPSYFTYDRSGFFRDSTMDSLKRQKLFKVFGNYNNSIGISMNGNVLALEGEKRRTLSKLDTATFEWTPILQNRVWLKSDFLRPNNDYRQYSGVGLITSLGNNIFIFYHTSLEKEDDKPGFACVDALDKKLNWDISLEKLDLENDNYPKASFVSGNNLLVIWIDDENYYLITAFDMATGKTKWTFKK